MFHVTDRAVTKLTELRDSYSSPPGQGIAVIPTEEGRLNLTLTHPAEDDHVIERDGDPIVIVPAPVIEQLDGWVLDYQEGAGEERFILAPAASSGGSPDGSIPG